jgi:hypothetical protein
VLTSSNIGPPIRQITDGTHFEALYEGTPPVVTFLRSGYALPSSRHHRHVSRVPDEGLRSQGIKELLRDGVVDVAGDEPAWAASCHFLT